MREDLMYFQHVFSLVCRVSNCHSGSVTGKTAAFLRCHLILFTFIILDLTELRVLMNEGEIKDFILRRV